MSYEMDELGVARVAEYFSRIGRHLPHKAQRASFATYAFGILADGERKSAEPIAARACADPALTRKAHDHLLHFLGVSGWANAPVRLEAARYAIEAMREHYTTIHRRPPAEADMQAFFQVSPPSVHQMVMQLERLGLVRRTPGAARSIELLVPPTALPLLEPR
jgi:hypothetical protein